MPYSIRSPVERLDSVIVKELVYEGKRNTTTVRTILQDDLFKMENWKTSDYLLAFDLSGNHFLSKSIKYNKVYIRGTGQNNSTNPIIQINGKEILKDYSRGLNLVILNSSLEVVFNKGYDTGYSSSASNSLASVLASMKSDEVGILVSYQTWEGEVTETLKNAAKNVGLSNLDTCESQYRNKAYAAIFHGTSNDYPQEINSQRHVLERIEPNSSNIPRATIFTNIASDGKDLSIGGSKSSSLKLNAVYSLNPGLADPYVFVDTTGKVGIGVKEQPEYNFHVKDGDSGLSSAKGGANTKFFFESNGSQWLELATPSSANTNGILFSSTRSNYGAIKYDTTDDSLKILTGTGQTRFYINSDGEISINSENPENFNFKINGTTLLDGDATLDGDLKTTLSSINLFSTNAATLNIGYSSSTTKVKGDLEVDKDLLVKGGDINTDQSTFNLLNTTTTTVNFGGAATTINIGNSSGNTKIKHNLEVTGSVRIKGNIYADEFHTQIVSSSIIYREGSTKFGDTSDDIHQFTGSIGIDQGSLTISGDLAVNGGDLTTTATTFNLLNATATTIAFAGASTDLTIGAETGTTTIRNDLAVNGGDITTTATSFNLLNTTATTIAFAGASTDLTIGAETGTTTIRNGLSANGISNGGNLAVNGGNITSTATTLNINAAGTVNIQDNLVVDGTLQVKGTNITTNQTSFDLLNTTATTLNFAGASTNLTIGAQTGTTTISNNATIAGDLAVNGGDITSTATTLNINAADTVNIQDNLVVDGNLQVKGNTTIGDASGDALVINAINQNSGGGLRRVLIDTDNKRIYYDDSVSSEKYKKNIFDYRVGLDATLLLRPVNFIYKSDTTKKVQAGLIAEEVAALGLEEFVNRDKEGSPDSLKYENMVVLLINSIKDLKQEIDNLKSEIEILKNG